MNRPTESYRNCRPWKWGIVHEGMDRLCIIPRNRWFNIYLHRHHAPDVSRVFVGAEDFPLLHDHPWHSLSIVLRGWLDEETPIKPLGEGRWERLTNEHTGTQLSTVPFICKRKPEDLHRLVNGSYCEGKPPITLFITGRKRRKWGFSDGHKWVEWDDRDEMENDNELS